MKNEELCVVSVQLCFLYWLLVLCYLLSDCKVAAKHK